MIKLIIQSFKMTIIFTVLTGLAYPLLVTGIAQTCFREQANGSLQVREGRIVGSTFLAQKFESDRYFWARPSASDYGALPAGASNFGPTSRALQSNVVARMATFRSIHKLSEHSFVPADMVFQSGSGVDPHISFESASMQLSRVASARNLSKPVLEALLAKFTEPPRYGFLGEIRVNVLLLNLAVDRL